MRKDGLQANLRAFLFASSHLPLLQLVPLDWLNEPNCGLYKKKLDSHGTSIPAKGAGVSFDHGINLSLAHQRVDCTTGYLGTPVRGGWRAYGRPSLAQALLEAAVMSASWLALSTSSTRPYSTAEFRGVPMVILGKGLRLNPKFIDFSSVQHVEDWAQENGGVIGIRNLLIEPPAT